ncbi:RNA polymerase sigma factor SigJ [Lysobacter sp. cf310]|uniref:RNA polymerase sigma factor SigJ n=1 Tax=Lysobacter sp. cf310 TaxID=1761790 RepID=UPI0008F0F1CD|nr:RNA polymerase sigma factor SigJ [Lysobacter sp. cf310]SFL09508.1 RNA polymerase sigma-70 factor, ECF subfamily [Lysobacter sp. cf310]
MAQASHPRAAALAATFESQRGLLIGLAYRILGSRADAEDAVQDTYLKWQDADHAAIDNPAAWLTTLCTRRSIDLLRSAHRSRVDYVGSWLPEPIHSASEDYPEAALSLASSLSTAFLLLLERLTPKERAAYLLYEIFDLPYPQIARTLELQEAACRKLVSRAKAHVEQGGVRHVTPQQRQDQLLAAFEGAIASGRTDDFAALLADDIELRADSGGKVPTRLDVLHGREQVLDFVLGSLRQYWGEYRWIVSDLNGARGVILEHDGHIAASLSFAYDQDGRATHIYIMRNPDKLAALDAPAIG